MEPLNWIAIASAGGGVSVIGFVTFWMAMGSRLTGAQKDAKAAENAAAHANLIASTSIGKVDLLARELADIRVQLSSDVAHLKAETQANIRSLTAAENRFAAAVDDLGKKMDHLSDTIIKTLGDLIKVKA